jgi:hypothetical protein
VAVPRAYYHISGSQQDRKSKATPIQGWLFVSENSPDKSLILGDYTEFRSGAREKFRTKKTGLAI